MNQYSAGMIFMTARERDLIRNDAHALVTDAMMSFPATYRDFQGSTFSPTLGTSVDSYIDLSITVHRGSVSAEEIAAAAGLYQRGDVRFLVERSMLMIPPAREDRIVVGTQTYELLDWASDPINALWAITARLVRVDGVLAFAETAAPIEALTPLGITP